MTSLTSSRKATTTTTPFENPAMSQPTAAAKGEDRLYRVHSNTCNARDAEVAK